MIMSDAEPAPPMPVGGAGSDLRLRVGSALVLAPAAIGVAYLGGWLFTLFWAGAAILVMREWTALVTGAERRWLAAAGMITVAIAAALAAMALGDGRATYLAASLAVLVLGMVALPVVAPTDRRSWVAAGVPYAGAMALTPLFLRSDAEFGFVAILFLFAVVWTTDIFAYFVGRAAGGPRLMPHVSPNKTWSGALGGAAAAAAVAVALAAAAGLSGLLAIAMLAIVLSVFAQAGDLFESFLKRRFGAKDSSHLIPGHGGLMDRLDGFVTASVAAALIGLARGGFEAPGRGLLVW
jgi:phosphatidate cytidylyltransferase